MSYDGVILAAGRNTRLAGMVPSFYKPLVIVNGRPLIVSLVQAMSHFCKRVVIVVSPQNAAPIAEILEANGLLNHRVTLVVQTAARGPGDGLYHALQACHEPRILMACGDNRIPFEDFEHAIEYDLDINDKGQRTPNAITVSTVRTLDTKEAERFTRVTEEGAFVENQPGGWWQDGTYKCWIGPLIFDRQIATQLFGNEVSGCSNSGHEIKISPVFNKLENLDIRTVSGHSVDIGTSDALVENQ